MRSLLRDGVRYGHPSSSGSFRDQGFVAEGEGDSASWAVLFWKGLNRLSLPAPRRGERRRIHWLGSVSGFQLPLFPLLIRYDLQQLNVYVRYGLDLEEGERFSLFPGFDSSTFLASIHRSSLPCFILGLVCLACKGDPPAGSPSCLVIACRSFQDPTVLLFALPSLSFGAPSLLHLWAPLLR